MNSDRHLRIQLKPSEATYPQQSLLLTARKDPFGCYGHDLTDLQLQFGVQHNSYRLAVAVFINSKTWECMHLFLVFKMSGSFTGWFSNSLLLSAELYGLRISPLVVMGSYGCAISSVP